jgi:hypothetical protein
MNWIELYYCCCIIIIVLLFIAIYYYYYYYFVTVIVLSLLCLLLFIAIYYYYYFVTIIVLLLLCLLFFIAIYYYYYYHYYYVSLRWVLIHEYNASQFVLLYLKLFVFVPTRNFRDFPVFSVGSSRITCPSAEFASAANHWHVGSEVLTAVSTKMAVF